MHYLHMLFVHVLYHLNKIRLAFVLLLKLKFRQVGPRIEPCGTPLVQKVKKKSFVTIIVFSLIHVSFLKV